MSRRPSQEEKKSPLEALPAVFSGGATGGDEVFLFLHSLGTRSASRLASLLRINSRVLYLRSRQSSAHRQLFFASYQVLGTRYILDLSFCGHRFEKKKWIFYIGFRVGAVILLSLSGLLLFDLLPIIIVQRIKTFNTSILTRVLRIQFITELFTKMYQYIYIYIIC